MPNINKVVYGNTTLIDLTDSTLSSTDQLAQGITAYDRSGTKITGTASGGGSAITVTEEQLSGGGTAKHITAVDISSDTVDAAHLAQGYTAHAADGTALTGTMTSTTVTPLSVTQNGTYTAPTGTAYSPVTVNVSGGGGGSAEQKQVNFIDYDGTILHSYTAAEANALTELPSNPSHSGLTAQGWNWTLAQIKAQLTAMPDSPIWVGQMYITDDGKTRIYCHFEAGRLAPYLGLGVNGTVVVDWGDNSATDTLTGTSLTTAKTVQHTYGAAGDYTITLTVSSGSFSFFGVSATAHILKKSTATSQGISRIYNNAVKRVELGAGSGIGNYAFNHCESMKTITIPSAVTSIGNYAFQYCENLVSVTIPKDITSIGDYAFGYCYSLSHITIPSTVTSIGNYAFYVDYALSSITIPNGVTSVGNYVFNGSHLVYVTTPNSLTSIGTYPFNACNHLVSLTILGGVTSISDHACYNCVNLVSVTIPDSVTSISAYAFGYCYCAAEYHLQPTTPPTLSNTNAFTSMPSDCVIYVPYSADHSILEAYQTAQNWSTYASYMQEEPQ